MNIKVLLYIIVTISVIWMLDGIDINRIFKKNRVWQATIFYLGLTVSLSYLIVNYFYDFFMYIRFI